MCFSAQIDQRLRELRRQVQTPAEKRINGSELGCTHAGIRVGRPVVTPKQSMAVTPFLAAALMTMIDVPVSVDSSNRYYRDVNGRPIFLIGYYMWAPPDPNVSSEHGGKLHYMINLGSDYDINYIRISLGLNRVTAITVPPSWDGDTSSTPFLYNAAGKVDLDRWNPAFWRGLKLHVELAAQKGVVVHVSLFDGPPIRYHVEEGVDISGIKWPNSFWNINNQASNYFGDLDSCIDNGTIDEPWEFYRQSDFVNNVGIGYYQRQLISKTVSELAGYDNVMYEVGNELFSSSTSWNEQVISYIKSRTDAPVTVSSHDMERVGSPVPFPPSNAQGNATHSYDTPAEVKSFVTQGVGQGRPFWIDPDGSDLNGGTADDLRRAAWYAFAGGAAGWGGFSADFYHGAIGFNTTKANYYRYLQRFIRASGIEFWKMVPRSDLVGNSAENSGLAHSGREYLAYVLNDDNVTLDLSSLSGPATARIYDPRTGVFKALSTVRGGGTVTFHRPIGTEDWLVHVKATKSLFRTIYDSLNRLMAKAFRSHEG